MNSKDKKMMEELMEDKGQTLKIIIDNDEVWVEKDEEVIHTFEEFGYELLLQVFNYIGLYAEFC